MAHENYSKNRIHVDYSEGNPFRCNGFHESDLSVSLNGDASRITIIATQPIHPSEDHTGFELVLEEVARQMCHSPFYVEKIVFHNLRDNGNFARQIKFALGDLKNE